MDDEVMLVDGTATHMGGGDFLVFQEDENGVVHSIFLTPDDLRKMLDV